MNHESSGADTRNQPQVSIVELGPEDWAILRDLKYKSLDQEPIAFEDVEEGHKKFDARPESEWRDILSGKMSGGRAGESLHVFAKDQLKEKYVGMVSAIIPEGQAVETKNSTLQNMFVDSEDRGRGVGKQLLRALIEKIKIRGDIKKIQLGVVVTQEPAIAMYKSLGFKEVGRIEKAAKRNGEEYDEIEMELELE